MKIIPRLAIAILALLAGCRASTPLSTPQAKVRRQTSAKLRDGMSEAEVAQALGQPTEFRPGNGTRDDVAVYRVQESDLYHLLLS